MNNEISRCPVCGCEIFHPLPDPSYKQSITTASVIINKPLGKVQCHRCGLVIRKFDKFLAETDFYETAYAYYNKPGAEQNQKVRYESLAKWMSDGLDFTPVNILDVGCGRGWTIREMKNIYKDSKISGIEPTTKEVEIANSNGINVIGGKIEDIDISEKFDFIYSNNVMQHVNDPLAFLTAQKRILKDGGEIFLSLPNGNYPDIELLMGDQNYSYNDCNLNLICDKAGFEIVKAGHNPDYKGLRNEMFVLLRKKTNDGFCGHCETDCEKLYYERCEYLLQWKKLNDYLAEEINRHKNKKVINFGAGLFSYILAAYCPDYWKKVDFCAIDGFEGKCLDKDVRKYDAGEMNGYTVVLGTNPEVQNKLKERFNAENTTCVTWNNIIKTVDKEVV